MSVIVAQQCEENGVVDPIGDAPSETERAARKTERRTARQKRDALAVSCKALIYNAAHRP